MQPDSDESQPRKIAPPPRKFSQRFCWKSGSSYPKPIGRFISVALTLGTPMTTAIATLMRWNPLRFRAHFAIPDNYVRAKWGASIDI